MKRILSTILCVFLFFSVGGVHTLAWTGDQSNDDVLLSKTVEILDDGGTITTELYRNSVQLYSGISGYRTKTYTNAAGVDVFAVTVNGRFSYTYGVSSKATSSEAKVSIYSGRAVYEGKNAYTSGNTAYASGTASHNGLSKTLYVSVSCDKYGNLS